MLDPSYLGKILRYSDLFNVNQFIDILRFTCFDFSSEISERDEQRVDESSVCRELIFFIDTTHQVGLFVLGESYSEGMFCPNA